MFKRVVPTMEWKECFLRKWRQVAVGTKVRTSLVKRNFKRTQGDTRPTKLMTLPTMARPDRVKA